MLDGPIASEYRSEIERQLFFVMSESPVPDVEGLRRKVAVVVESDVASRGLDTSAWPDPVLARFESRLDCAWG